MISSLSGIMYKAINLELLHYKIIAFKIHCYLKFLKHKEYDFNYNKYLSISKNSFKLINKT